MKIFLDNNRDIPEKWHFCIVRNYKDCTLLLSVSPQIEYISLDYNLGEGAGYTGLDVLTYMKENKINPDHINIHSTNLYGVPKMKDYAKQNFSGSIITEDKFGEDLAGKGR